MNEFIKETINEIKKISPDIKIINFGHLGDNNLHFNILSSETSNYNTLIKNKDKITGIIYSKTYKYHGSFSAEHGIGQLKRKELKKYKPKEEIEQMLKIKKNFDPNNILNPGKIF